jgi:hypothetical protein
LFSHITGEECPLPGRSNFHFTFSVALNFSGASGTAMPSFSGPRQRGDRAKTPKLEIKIHVAPPVCFSVLSDLALHDLDNARSDSRSKPARASTDDCLVTATPVVRLGPPTPRSDTVL